MKPQLNCFLQTRVEIDQASNYIKTNGIPSGLDCKNWDVYKIASYLKDGNLLDMGSDGSVILDNAVKLGIKGRKVGIDLAYKLDHITVGDLSLYKGDLVNTPFPDQSFDQLTCLSVVEHQVDYNFLAKECARLLKPNGELFLSCDFWNPKPDTTKMRLYNLNWNILDQKDLQDLITALQMHHLTLTSEIDWTLTDPVIDPSYCAPTNVSYTFGIFHFIKS